MAFIPSSMEMERVSQEQQSELFIVVEEIMSQQRERRALLASLTPEVSVWKHDGNTLVSRFAGKDDRGGKDYTAAPLEDLVQEMETEEQLRYFDSESASTEELLGRYFDSILQDMEDLSHRMLSMASAVKNPNCAAISMYTADELLSSTSRLRDACKELYEDTKDNEQAEEDKNTFLYLSDLFMNGTLMENELALVVTKKEKENYEKETEKEKIRMHQLEMESREKVKQWQQKGKGKVKEFESTNQDQKGKENANTHPDTMEYLKKGMEFGLKFFADHRDGWNNVWGSRSTVCGDFLDKTTLSPMQFTHYTTDTIPSSCGVTGSTLQIYSIKILELKQGLKWPLKLYGVVAARDTVDRNRNIVFSRSRLNCQELGENDSLCLTGPSRAIVALDSVDFEVELKIKEGEKSQGKELITLRKRYEGSSTGTPLIFESSLCKAVLELEQLFRAVQATIVGVCVVDGKWPFEYGCRVVCSLVGAADEVVLLEGGSKEVHVGSNHYLHLSRNVVSVQLPGTLKVVIRAYSKSGEVDLKWDFDFIAQQCQTTEGESLAQQCQTTERESLARRCKTTERRSLVGTSKVKVVVAWSLLVKEKRDLLVVWPAVKP